MTVYTWDPEWVPNRFALYVAPNERFFPGYYSGQGQATDLLGERWRCRMQLPPDTDQDLAGRWEAFFDRLLGRVHQVSLYNFRRPVPLGTMRGTPTVRVAAAQLSSTLEIQTTAGVTLQRGDMIGFGGQVSRVSAYGIANGSGQLSVSVTPRVRAPVPAGSAVLWDRPQITFRLASGDGVPIDHSPGYFDGPAIELVED